jgi:hypothetical protein
MPYWKHHILLYNFFIIFLLYVFFYNTHLLADNTIPITYGGNINLTLGRLAGVRSGTERISGYGWLSTYHKINDDYFMSSTLGVSLEGQSANTIILNDMSVGLHSQKNQLLIGRTLNASGKLHHDIIDFGAPGGGSDNNPISYFYNGNYTTNVAQRLTLPFTKRIAYYAKPYKEYLALGISYAPQIGTYHAENYQFFAEAPIKDEVSAAFNSEIQINKVYIGITSGYTQAYRTFNQVHSFGLITATQYSIFVKEKLSQEKFYNLYEVNRGCLDDKNTKDCRIGFQISKIKNRYTRNIGVQHRLNNNALNPSHNADYFIGWSWSMQPNVRIGFETILRIEETKKQDTNQIRSDFNWLTGIQYRF